MLYIMWSGYICGILYILTYIRIEISLLVWNGSIRKSFEDMDAFIKNFTKELSDFVLYSYSSKIENLLRFFNLEI